MCYSCLKVSGSNFHYLVLMLSLEFWSGSGLEVNWKGSKRGLEVTITIFSYKLDWLFCVPSLTFFGHGQNVYKAITYIALTKYRKVASTNASRFVASLAFKHT